LPELWFFAVWWRKGWLIQNYPSILIKLHSSCFACIPYETTILNLLYMEI